MAGATDKPALDPEIAAINNVVLAIRDLDASTQQNVVDYVIRRFKLEGSYKYQASALPPRNESQPAAETKHDETGPTSTGSGEADGLEGVSPVARKWVSRSGLDINGLSSLFSLGIEEIDLVAKKVPGKSKKERMLNVILLKGVAAYLGSGVARVAHEQVKETCLHYDAFDTSNFSSYLKEFSAEVGGTKEAGYTLTARGLTDATQVVKAMLTAPVK